MSADKTILSPSPPTSELPGQEPTSALTHVDIGPLPNVRSPLSQREILTRLDTASRRGTLPGYAGAGTSAFVLAAFGEPFDRTLAGTMKNINAPAETGGPGQADARTVVSFDTRMRWKLPALFAFIIAISVWPGVWLTHSMLVTYFSWYKIETWWWYLPLTVGPLFWMLPKMMRKSRVASHASALGQIQKVAAAIDGSLIP